MVAVLPGAMATGRGALGIRTTSGPFESLARGLAPVAQPLLIVGLLLLVVAALRCSWAATAIVLVGGVLLYVSMYRLPWMGSSRRRASLRYGRHDRDDGIACARTLSQQYRRSGRRDQRPAFLRRARSHRWRVRLFLHPATTRSMSTGSRFLMAQTSAPTSCFLPTLRSASVRRDSCPHSELANTEVTLAIIASIAHTG